MTYRNSRLIVILYIIAIAGLGILLAVVVLEGNRLFVPVSVVVLLFGVSISLIRYIERTTSELTRFLLSIREGIYMDETTSVKSRFPENKFSSALNDITREFARVAEDKELQYQYLKTLNENISAGLISVNSDGSIRLLNPAAKKLLNILHLSRFHDLARVNTPLYEFLSALKPEQSELYRFISSGEEYQLSVRMKEIVMQGETVKIFLLQNINSELDQKEIEAWQQLTRVLTHEIMNSVTPIVSLGKAAQRLVVNNNNEAKPIKDLTEENIQDLAESINTIVGRSQNLIRFVDNYKSFTRSLQLKFEAIDMVGVVSRVVSLMEQDAKLLKVSLAFDRPAQPIVLEADVPLVEQVVINLVKNALEAVPKDGSGSIRVTLEKAMSIVRLTVSDNGAGIDEETMPKIFVPFFTTKPNGSGVGLSLSRQIMRTHRGTIKVKSSPGVGTVFALEWNT